MLGSLRVCCALVGGSSKCGAEVVTSFLGQSLVDAIRCELPPLFDGILPNLGAWATVGSGESVAAAGVVVPDLVAAYGRWMLFQRMTKSASVGRNADDWTTVPTMFGSHEESPDGPPTYLP